METAAGRTPSHVYYAAIRWAVAYARRVKSAPATTAKNSPIVRVVRGAKTPPTVKRGPPLPAGRVNGARSGATTAPSVGGTAGTHPRGTSAVAGVQV
ncbi:hypothetical protein [Nocardia amikacinitolerans]|uniref:hypothetical protein n=1 Tax=Nocardia amikacinitolerans TaxID=756689 RepID=UPI00117E0277|nr:hypothetical protein [Nocardia amikacinitolerans]